MQVSGFVSSLPAGSGACAFADYGRGMVNGERSGGPSVARRRLAQLGWLAVAFAAALGALSLVGRWLPVEPLAFITLGVLAAVLWTRPDPGQIRDGWQTVVFLVLMTLGIGLVFGGILSDSDQTGVRVGGSILGALLIAGAYATAIVGIQRRRRRAAAAGDVSARTEA